MNDIRKEMAKIAEGLCLEAERFRIEAPDLSQQLWEQARGILSQHVGLDYKQALPRSRALVPLSPPTPKSPPRRNDPVFGTILSELAAKRQEIRRSEASALDRSTQRRRPFRAALRLFSAAAQWLAGKRAGSAARLPAPAYDGLRQGFRHQ